MTGKRKNRASPPKSSRGKKRKHHRHKTSKRELSPFPRNKREREQQWDAFDALGVAKRERLTRSQAAAAEGIGEKELDRWTRGAWKRRGKEYVPKGNDRLVRPLSIPGKKGPELYLAPGSRASSEVSAFYRAVRDARQGKPAALRAFRGKNLPGTKRKYPTNLALLRRLDEAGLLNVETIYWRKRLR